MTVAACPTHRAADASVSVAHAGVAVATRVVMRVIGLLLLAACGTTIRATDINPAPRPLAARPPESVEVFTSGPPARAYKDLAFFEAQQQSEFSSDNTREFIIEMRAEAARRGCDGLVIGGITHETRGTFLDSHEPTSNKGLTATCIVYTADEPALAASGAGSGE